jgi:PAS domain-containing protein
MRDDEEEEALLRSVAMQNAQSIVLARQRAEAALLQAKQALERKSQEQRATLQATWDGILVTDDRGHVTDYNTRYVEM